MKKKKKKVVVDTRVLNHEKGDKIEHLYRTGFGVDKIPKCRRQTFSDGSPVGNLQEIAYDIGLDRNHRRPVREVLKLRGVYVAQPTDFSLRCSLGQKAADNVERGRQIRGTNRQRKRKVNRISFPVKSTRLAGIVDFAL